MLKWFAASAVVCAIALADRPGGRYGRWIESAAGNPVYRYELDQLADKPDAHGHGWAGDPPSADISVRGSREHTFQIGNDRLVLVANNYGAVRVRSDEGSPKWFTAAEGGETGSAQFGGGFGYLSKSTVAEATTYFTGGASDRDFGIGWVSTSATSATAVVNHTVATPYGDDPVVLVEVTVHNTGNTTESWDWVEVWGSSMAHLDPSWARTLSASAFTAAHYNSSWSLWNASSGLNNAGAEHRREWLGLTPQDRAHLDSVYKYPVPAGAGNKGGGIWDEEPGTPYLIQAVVGSGGQDNPATVGMTTMGNDALAFFGSGGVADPTGTIRFSPEVEDPNAALIASTPITVPAGESVRIHYIWGYAEHSQGSEAAAATMLEKYKPLLRGPNGLAAAVEAEWTPFLAKFEIAAKGYVSGETAWHSYYLQAAVTWDSYMQEHIVDQGTVYRYSSGFQGAARDPVQHALPLIELRPLVAKSVLRYTLSEMYTNFTNVEPAEPGLLPYALYGRAIIADGSSNPLLAAGVMHLGGTAIRPDDMELYLLLCAAEYILGTKDVAFVNETVSFFGQQGEQTVLRALQRAVHFVVDVIGTGPHGLIREMTSDWDDGIAVRPDFPRDFNQSESVLTASLATHALDRIAAALEMVEDQATAAKAKRFAASNRKAIRESTFNGKWLRRAWFGNETGWIGDYGATATHGKGMFSAQHGWAMLGGVFDQDKKALNATLSSLTTHCRAGSKYGYAYICDPERPPLESSSRHLLQYPNAPGMWPAVDHPIILGLLAVNQTALAWEEYERNSLHWQTSVSPNSWVGIWTSSDSVNGDGSPSEWSTDFPGLCTHRHAWPLVTARHLAGVTYTSRGVHIRPSLPTELGRYEWITPLASVAWDGNHTWSGHYSPSAPSQHGWEVTVDMALVLAQNTRIQLIVGNSSGGSMDHKQVVAAVWEGSTISCVAPAGWKSIWFNIVAGTRRV